MEKATRDYGSVEKEEKNHLKVDLYKSKLKKEATFGYSLVTRGRHSG